MAFHPNSADHAALDRFLALILDATKTEELIEIDAWGV
jgi:hypothetical protein